MSTRLHLGPLEGLALRGTGSALPSDLERRELPGRLTNREVIALVLGEGWEQQLADRGLDPDHAERVHGIAAREWTCRPGQRPGANALDLAALAAARALDDADLRGRELDAIVASTSTPTSVTASFAAKVGAAVGSEAACFDLRAGGAGSLYAWIQAALLLGAGARRVLVAAADCPSHYIDPKNLSQALLYGDAGGALVLERNPDSAGALLTAELGRADLAGRPFTVPAELPPTGDEPFVFDNPDQTYSQGLLARWRQAGERLATIGGKGRGRVLVPYAVHSAQLDAVAAPLGEPSVLHSLANHGCIGAGSIAFALDRARRSGVLAPNAEVLTAAVAGGAVWAVAHLRLG